MTTAQNVETLTLIANAALPLYRFVSLNSSGKVALTAANARMDGVTAQEALVADEPIAVAQMQAIMKVEAGAAVTAGALVGSDASGRAVAAGTALNDYSGGVAIDAASAAGEIVRVLLHSPDRHGGAT